MRGNIDERGKKLFIGGLHLKTTEDSLKAFYTQWGDLIDVVVMRDPHTGRSRGFGFVTYSDPASVDLAQGNRPHEIDGIKVDAKRAMPKEDTSVEFHATVNRLFVGRLKKSLNADDLKQYFGEYGTIDDAVVINNPNGESRGFGFVTFEDPDSVDKVIVSRPHELDGQLIEVKKAMPRDEGGKGSTRPTTTTRTAPRGGAYNGAPRGGSYNSAPRGGSYSSNAPRGGGYPNSAPREYNAPRGGYSNTSYNPRFQEDSSGSSFYNSDNYSNGAPYQSQYAAPNRQPSIPQYSDSQFDGGYSGQQTYNSETEYNSFGQYSASAAQPPQGRPYGYPPQSVMNDYSQKAAGGPMRGSGAGFGRGGARYGTQPY